MLTVGNAEALERDRESISETTEGRSESKVSVVTNRNRLSRALRVEWLGQTAASLCWIASVFTYGISSVGDWLQLLAASAWLLANIASLMSADSD